MNPIYRQVKHSGMATVALTMLAAVVILAGIAIPAQAQTETLLHQFSNSPDGAQPYSGLTLKGTTLYGTTANGGDAAGDGVVYAISTTTGKETILHTFGGQPNGDGSLPYGGVAFDKAGNIYGTTLGGGQYNYGTIYKLTKSGKNYVESVLHSFSCADGCAPSYVTPVFDKAGNLYGTTFYGGYYGNGTVFKMTPNGTLTTLYSFHSAIGDGYSPNSGVVLDTKGNLYGATPIGGASGDGTLYEITASGAYSTLYNFTGGADGLGPRSALVYKGGSLYGTTQAGGAGCTWGCGVIFKFTPAKGKKAGKLTVLHTFAGVPDGMSPMYGALVFDNLGTLYGTTENGGAFPGGTNLGTVYKLAPDGTMTVLYAFDQLPDGMAPYGNVARDTKGNLYTTAACGGNGPGWYGGGTVIKVTP
jgi:uncharacterized repeat protein (TIGR03803 family)